MNNALTLFSIAPVEQFAASKVKIHSVNLLFLKPFQSLPVNNQTYHQCQSDFLLVAH